MSYHTKSLNTPKENISYRFIFRYWLKNTILAGATGFAIGLAIPFFPFRHLGGTILGLFIYQIVVCSYFWGKRRGDFEYIYRKIFLEKIIKQIIIKYCSRITYYRFYFDQFNSISSYQWEICQKLLSDKEILSDNDLIFFIYLKAAKISLKEDSFDREIKYLKKALTIKPNDLVVNCKLAVAMERARASEKAISAYEAALKDPLITDKMIVFLKAQIERVKLKGPSIKQTSPGLRDTSR